MNGFNLSPANEAKLAAVIREVATSPMNAHFAACKAIVRARGVEPREGFVANELSVELPNGVEVSVEGRRRSGVSIVRWNGVIVLHQCDSMGHATYLPGDWEDEITAALAAIETDDHARRTIEHSRAKATGDFVVSKIAA